MAYFHSLRSFVKIGHLVHLLKRGDTNTHADSRDISLAYLLMERKQANIKRENYRVTALQAYFEMVLNISYNRARSSVHSSHDFVLVQW
jgi:hypothetical protein